jgi:hypothetical protein
VDNETGNASRYKLTDERRVGIHIFKQPYLRPNRQNEVDPNPQAQIALKQLADKLNLGFYEVGKLLT